MPSQQIELFELDSVMIFLGGHNICMMISYLYQHFDAISIHVQCVSIFHDK